MPFALCSMPFAALCSLLYAFCYFYTSDEYSDNPYYYQITEQSNLSLL